MGVSAISTRAVLAALLLAAAPAAHSQRNLELKTSQQGSEQRVALLIGNAAYQQGALRNPVNDVRAMAERLQRLGFVVIKRENLKSKEIGPALREFRSRLSAGATALFFYAGHGLQVKGVNYLPTVDADIEAEEDVYTQALNVSNVLELMEEAKTRVNLVFLDACRNNPFSRRFRSAAGGLAKVDAASGTLISFATRPGSVAADGEGKNGLYTEYLLKHMDDAGLPIELMLKRVGAGVKLASKGRQEPWSEGLIEGEFYFRAAVQTVSAQPAVPPSAAPQARIRSEVEIEEELWDTIKDGRDSKNFEEYLSTYPNGRFAASARARLRALAAPVTPPPPTAQSAPQVVAAVNPVPTTAASSYTEVECLGLVRSSGKTTEKTDYKEAAEGLRTVIDRCHKLPPRALRQAHTNLGVYYISQERWGDAVQELRLATRLADAGGISAYIPYVDLAYALSQRGADGSFRRNPEAMAALRKAAQIGPANAVPAWVLDPNGGNGPWNSLYYWTDISSDD